MRYIDSGARDPAQALGTWLNAQLGAAVVEVRIQSGFYSSDALAPFRPVFATLAAGDRVVSVVVGSNDGGTLRSHLDDLVAAVGVPRSNGRLGVVYFGGAYFHPKAYHIRRADGSQAAYVGSANFTLSGIGAKHVEAGVIVDTREGDPEPLLTQIAEATDAWFVGAPAGFDRIQGPADVQRLYEEGIVRAAPPPRPPRPLGLGGLPPQRPTLAPLVVFTLPKPAPSQAAASATSEQSPAWTPLPTVQQTPPYPPHIFFAPYATTPTRDADALTGLGLGDAIGLVLRLSRDSDRHWRQASGTSNISVPVSTAATLRFGVFGERKRPRAEFDFMVRYIDDQVTLAGPLGRVGVMSFGFSPGDNGHADLRLALPKSPIEAVRAQLVAQGLRLPQSQDYAALEWPTPVSPAFRLTVTNPASSIGKAMADVWNRAAASETLASRGAAWLPLGLAPPWAISVP